MQFSRALLLFAFLAPPPAHVSRAAAPPALAPRSFVLKNGMRVTLVHVLGERRVAVALDLATGEVDEPSFGPGLSMLTANLLLEGTVARSASQIVSEARSLGGTVSVTSGPMTTAVSGDAASEHVAHMIWLISDLVRHPLLDTASFERVRHKALAALDSAMHRPADQARQQWRAMVFPGHPYGSPYSYASTLTALQLGHARNVYDDNYGASRAHLYVSGEFDDVAAESAIRDALSDWKGGMPERPRPAAPEPQAGARIIDWPGAQRTTIWIGKRVLGPASPGFETFEVLDAVVAGTRDSRIATRLQPAIVRASLAPAGGFAPSAIWAHPGASYWVEALEVDREGAGSTMDAVFAELDRVRRETPPAVEVEHAKEAVRTAFSASIASRTGMLQALRFADEHGLGDDWIDAHLRRLAGVTPQQVQATANAELDPAHMTITVVGDRAAMEPLIARLRTGAR